MVLEQRCGVLPGDEGVEPVLRVVHEEGLGEARHGRVGGHVRLAIGDHADRSAGLNGAFAPATTGAALARAVRACCASAACGGNISIETRQAVASARRESKLPESITCFISHLIVAMLCGLKNLVAIGVRGRRRSVELLAIRRMRW